MSYEYIQSDRIGDYDLLVRIKEIDEVLASGVSTVTIDGTVTKIELDQLRLERRQLIQRLPGLRAARPVVSRVNLGGF
ncbi:MAG: hypothetical protein Rhob2KO_12340 [Rhodopirellula baltica]